MSKQDDSAIKLEIAKDNQGKLRIAIRFNSKASNVIIKNNEYMWIPTLEEKALIDEAFQFLPSDDVISKESTPKAESAIEPKIEEPEPSPEPIVEEEPVPEPVKVEEPEEVTPPVQKEEPAVFEVTPDEEPPKIDDFDKKMDTIPEPKPIEEPPVEEPPKEEPIEKIPEPTVETPVEKPIEEPIKRPLNEPEPMAAKVEIKQDEVPEEKPTNQTPPEDEGILVEADANAIENALRRHADKSDESESFKQADEQTIIDRVLRQKKKGKWSRK